MSIRGTLCQCPGASSVDILHSTQPNTSYLLFPPLHSTGRHCTTTPSVSLDQKQNRNHALQNHPNRRPRLSRSRRAPGLLLLQLLFSTNLSRRSTKLQHEYLPTRRRRRRRLRHGRHGRHCGRRLHALRCSGHAPRLTVVRGRQRLREQGPRRDGRLHVCIPGAYPVQLLQDGGRVLELLWVDVCLCEVYGVH
jgi:hypothetical protein